MEKAGWLAARRRVFQNAAGQEKALDPDSANPLHASPYHGQKNNQHQGDRSAITPAVGEQRHHALVLLRVGVVMRPVMKPRANRHRHHGKQLRHQQRHDGAPESKTLEAEEVRHGDNRL